MIVAERAAGTAAHDPQPAIDAISAAVSRTSTDYRSPTCASLPAGAIPRTTSGKLARRACRAAYLGGVFD